jgi:hypothetical protein
MSKKVFRKTPKSIKLILVLIILVAIGYGTWFFASRPPIKPPAEFLVARQKGAEISQKIVELASSTTKEIEEINSLDLNGDYPKALILIEEAKNKNQEMLNQAVDLAKQMQIMTESLGKISVSKNRELAMKAITTETYLLTNFMQYKDILDEFLRNLNGAIATSKSEYRQAAENNRQDLNIKASTINNLNQQFIEQMAEFDKSFL